jgi:cytochrome c5
MVRRALRAPLLVAALVASVTVSAAACSSDPDVTPADASAPSDAARDTSRPPLPPAGPRELPCEIDALLSSRCHACHDGQLALPRLVTHEDLTAPYPAGGTRTLAEVALGRITAERGFMPPPPRPRPTEAEVDAFRAWVTGGRPKGTCAPDAGASDASPTDGAPADAASD